MLHLRKKALVIIGLISVTTAAAYLKDLYIWMTFTIHLPSLKHEGKGLIAWIGDWRLVVFRSFKNTKQETCCCWACCFYFVLKNTFILKEYSYHMFPTSLKKNTYTFNVSRIEVPPIQIHFFLQVIAAHRDYCQFSREETSGWAKVQLEMPWK